MSKNTFELRPDDEYIELIQLMKRLGWVGTGGEAKIRIENGEILVNDEVEYRKRRKLKKGFIVQFANEKLEVV